MQAARVLLFFFAFAATLGRARAGDGEALEQRPQTASEIVATPWPDVEAALTPHARVALASLPPAPTPKDATERLHRLAQVGHALHAADAYGQSESWLAIMGWEEDTSVTRLRPGAPRWRSHEGSMQRFPVPEARFDPVVDFAASFALAHLDARSFGCQFPLRLRFLQESGLVSTPSGVARRPCLYEKAWLHGRRVVGADLVYVAQRWQDAAASMGHVFLRLRIASDGEVRGGRTDPVVAWVATDPPETPNYILKGLTGGLHAGVKFDTFGEAEGRYGVREGRDMFVYALKLTDRELTTLVTALAARRGGESGVAYAFFTENCATMAWKMLRAVMPDLPRHPGWMFHPHEVASGLIRHGRATFVEVIRARRGRGIAAEEARVDTVRTLEARGLVTSEVARHLARMDGAVSERAEALVAIGNLWRRASPPFGEAATLWSRWVDATLDIEAFAVDVKAGAVNAHETSDAFEAALALRALLVTVSERSRQPLPVGSVGPSGSRSGYVAAGLRSESAASDDARVLLVWDTAVLDEEPGEARQAAFRRSARMRVLANRLAISSRGDDVAIEENRLTLLETADWGRGFVTEGGSFQSRLGWAFAAETLSRPRQHLPFALMIRGGPGFRLVGDPERFDYLVARAELEGSTWVGRAYSDSIGRGVIRGGFEWALQLGAPEHRWRTFATAGVAFSPHGVTSEFEIRTRLEFNLDPVSGLGLRIEGQWAEGRVVGNGWQALVGLVY